MKALPIKKKLDAAVGEVVGLCGDRFLSKSTMTGTIKKYLNSINSSGSVERHLCVLSLGHIFSHANMASTSAKAETECWYHKCF